MRDLIAKDFRELATSRAWAAYLLLIGPLVGQGFITAVETYAEVSGGNGGTPALAQGISPLDGIIVPTFGAYALAASLLFPFVAIRPLAAEKQSGASRLLQQSPHSAIAQLLSKFLVLAAAWILSWIPGLIALGMWRAYGGHLDAGETSVVLVGYLLRGVLTSALGLAAAAVTDSAATAAVVTLAATLGTWAIDFIAQVRGGWLRSVAAFTPESALRSFEQGELRLAVAAVLIVVAGGAIGLATVWSVPARALTRRVAYALALVALTIVGAILSARLRPSWDLSEDRRNSFEPAAERTLSRIDAPVHITVHLAPSDPRLSDLENGILRKLRRLLPDLSISYVATGSSGLFEPARSSYGEVWYDVGGRREMSRSTTVPIVLETVYRLAGVTPPASGTDNAYPGWPLVAVPRGASVLFYAVWPLCIIGALLVSGRIAGRRPRHMNVSEHK